MAESMVTASIELLFEGEGTPEVAWIVINATVSEQLNEPYSAVVTLAVEDTGAEPIKLLGKSGKLTMLRGASMRQVTGIVAAVEEGSTHPQRLATKVVLRPALEALRHRTNTKIFQEKTVPQILEEVLGEGLGAYGRSLDNRCARSYKTCDYRVQYDESDLAFCQRLMEEEGIAYWFEFDGDTELLVLADSPAKFGTIESFHGGPLTYTEYQGGVGGHEYVGELHVESRVRPTKVATRHFDWNAPSTFHEGESTDSASGDVPNGATVTPVREVYHHDSRPLTFEPGGTTYAGDMDDQITVRREAQRTDARAGVGWSTVFGMKIAATFELSGHTRADLDGEYLVVACSHDYTAGGLAYRNHFRCIPKDAPYRPRRLTPKPRLPSIQTAIVVGPAGEEIHTDEHGRIKVQFHWDRLGASDDHSSCWIRVQQPWAGASWGFVFIPRIGMEVVVDFVDGDPDLPMVLGCVYNGENPVPYALPGEKTKSTIKTNSSLGGGGSNELRFEDKKGSEEVYTHAQKDQNEVVENDHTTTVHHDQKIRVDNDQNQEVGNNQTEHVFVNQDLTVDADRTIAVHGNYTETIDGSETRTVSSGSTETIDAGETRTVTGGMTESISGGRTQTINGSSTETITGSLSQDITGGATITTPGAVTLTAVGGFKLTAEAGSKITTNTYTLIAPGGNTHHDQWWKCFAAKWNDNFMLKLDAVLVKNDNIAASVSLNAGFFIDTKGGATSVVALYAKTRTINGDSKAEEAEAAAVTVDGATARVK